MNTSLSKDVEITFTRFSFLSSTPQAKDIMPAPCYQETVEYAEARIHTKGIRFLPKSGEVFSFSRFCNTTNDTNPSSLVNLRVVGVGERATCSKIFKEPLANGSRIFTNNFAPAVKHRSSNIGVVSRSSILTFLARQCHPYQTSHSSRYTTPVSRSPNKIVKEPEPRRATWQERG